MSHMVFGHLLCFFVVGRLVLGVLTHVMFRYLFIVDIVMFAMMHLVLHPVMAAFDMLMFVMMHMRMHHFMAIFDAVSSAVVHIMFMLIHLMLSICVGSITIETRVFELRFVDQGFLFLSCLWPSVSPVKPNSRWAKVC